MLPKAHWHRGFGPDDNHHPWASRTCAEILDEVPDPIARRYLEITAHSDMATEPHLTNGLIGLRNFLKSVAGYGAQYSIEGGMEMLPRALASSLVRTDVVLDTPAVEVSVARHDRYILTTRRARQVARHEFDAVVIALPYQRLPEMTWAGERLRRAMAAHVAHYDWPGHYLRVSILFDRPFWRHRLTGSWVMLDAFGGCCVYADPPAHSAATHGVLGWLLAGSEALSSCNSDDRTLIARVLESLPDDLYVEARRRMIEGKVHRWAGAVSGQPGGCPLRDMIDSAPARTARASRTRRGWRLPVRLDIERRAAVCANRDRPAALPSALPISLLLSLFALDSDQFLRQPARDRITDGRQEVLNAEGEARRGRPGPAESAAGHRARSTGIRARPVDGSARVPSMLRSSRACRSCSRTPPIARSDGFETLPKFDVDLADFPDIPSGADQPGDTIGPYRLLRELGSGGMGVVWLAERSDGLVKRAVALKLPHQVWQRAGLAERMAREREILATLAPEHRPPVRRRPDRGASPVPRDRARRRPPIDTICRDRRLDTQRASGCSSRWPTLSPMRTPSSSSTAT